MDRRTARYVLVHALVLLVGGALGYAPATLLKEAVNAALLGVLSAVLAYATFVVHRLDDAFSKQIEQLAKLPPTRRAALASYISAQRWEVHIGWYFILLAAAVCGFAVVTVTSSTVSTGLGPRVQEAVFILSYALFAVALPSVLRVARYFRRLDAFREDIAELVREQELRTSFFSKRPTAKVGA
jgi:hypothetical protein